VDIGSGFLIGCWPLAVGRWPLAVGRWLLALGSWLLALGSQLSALRASEFPLIEAKRKGEAQRRSGAGSVMNGGRSTEAEHKKQTIATVKEFLDRGLTKYEWDNVDNIQRVAGSRQWVAGSGQQAEYRSRERVTENGQQRTGNRGSVDRAAKPAATPTNPATRP